MKRVILDDYLRENRGAYTRMRLNLEHGGKPLRRSRSVEEREILLRLDLARRERWLKEGRLEVLGPRRFRLNFFPVERGE